MSINNVQFMGNLGADPKLDTTPSGRKICKFSIAVTENFENAKGEKQKHTEWINCVVWGKYGETVHRGLKKGQQAIVFGKQRTEKWQDDGKERIRVDCICNKVHFDPLRLLTGSKET